MLQACQDGVPALGTLYLELRVIGVQRAVSMFIVVVQVVATCPDLVCAVSAGVDIGKRSVLELRFASALRFPVLTVRVMLSVLLMASVVRDFTPKPLHFHSCRSATIGSTFVARRAGM